MTRSHAGSQNWQSSRPRGPISAKSDGPNRPGLMPMPLTLEVDESDFGWCSVPDVVVVEAFSGEFASAGAFGDARVGAESSDRIRTLEDLGEGVPNVRGESVRGKNPPAR